MVPVGNPGTVLEAIQEDEPQRAAYRRIGAHAAAEQIVGGIDADAVCDRTVDQDHDGRSGKRRGHVMQAELGCCEAFDCGEDYRQVLGLATRHHALIATFPRWAETLRDGISAITASGFNPPARECPDQVGVAGTTGSRRSSRGRSKTRYAQKRRSERRPRRRPPAPRQRLASLSSQDRSHQPQHLSHGNTRKDTE